LISDSNLITRSTAFSLASPRLMHFFPFTTVEMEELQVTPLNDDHDLYKVCLSSHGISACTLVSSWHLVEEKRKQLEQSIIVVSRQAFNE
jgi:hypothetical protein